MVTLDGIGQDRGEFFRHKMGKVIVLKKLFFDPMMAKQ